MSALLTQDKKLTGGGVVLTRSEALERNLGLIRHLEDHVHRLGPDAVRMRAEAEPVTNEAEPVTNEAEPVTNEVEPVTNEAERFAAFLDMPGLRAEHLNGAQVQLASVSAQFRAADVGQDTLQDIEGAAGLTAAVSIAADEARSEDLARERTRAVLAAAMGSLVALPGMNLTAETSRVPRIWVCPRPLTGPVNHAP